MPRLICQLLLKSLEIFFEHFMRPSCFLFLKPPITAGRELGNKKRWVNFMGRMPDAWKDTIYYDKAVRIWLSTWKISQRSFISHPNNRPIHYMVIGSILGEGCNPKTNKNSGGGIFYAWGAEGGAKNIQGHLPCPHLQLQPQPPLHMFEPSATPEIFVEKSYWEEKTPTFEKNFP